METIVTNRKWSVLSIFNQRTNETKMRLQERWRVCVRRGIGEERTNKTKSGKGGSGLRCVWGGYHEADLLNYKDRKKSTRIWKTEKKVAIILSIRAKEKL